jgi:3-hydroxybutyrate dehydrogenase
LLKGKCALVTGSTGGLGFAIADKLAANGANVILNGLCPEAEGLAAADRIRAAHNVEAIFDQADLQSVAAIEAMIHNAEQNMGGVDILLNNAVVRNVGPLEDLQPDNWDQAVAVNLSAAFHCVRLTLPSMKAKRWGRIINMASVYSSRGAENRIDYVTTKTALLGMTRAIAIEAAPHGVTCNALSPGSVPSPAILGKLKALAADSGRALEDVTRDYVSERHFCQSTADGPQTNS